MTEHRLTDNTLIREADGVVARCTCGWISKWCFSSMTASARFEAHAAGCPLPDDLSSSPPPIDMLLWCPACHARHIDAPAPGDNPPWDNPPHRSHLCAACGAIWRPADVATNGVARIHTEGRADTLIFDRQENKPPAKAEGSPR